MNNNELIKKCNTQTLIPSQSQKKEVFHLFGSNQTVTEFFYQLPEHLKVRLYEGHFRGQVEINNTNLVPIDSDVGKVINYLNNQQKQIMKKVSEGIDELQTELNHSRQENQKLKTEGEKIFKEFSSLEGKLQRKNQLLRNTNVKFEQLSQTLEENISTGLQRIELLSSASDNQNDLAIKLRLAEFEAFKYCSRNHLLEQNVENLKMLLNEEQENLALFQNKYNRDVKKLQFDIKSLENDKKMFEKINQRLEKEKNETFTKYKESEKKYQSLLIKWHDVEKGLQAEINQQKVELQSLKVEVFIQSLASASQGIFRACLPPVISSPLNTTIQTYSAYRFIWIAPACSGFLFVGVIFVVLWECLFKRVCKRIWNWLVWVKAKSVSSKKQK